jgi:hypothetical protein
MEKAVSTVANEGGITEMSKPKSKTKEKNKSNNKSKSKDKIRKRKVKKAVSESEQENRDLEEEFRRIEVERSDFKRIYFDVFGEQYPEHRITNDNSNAKRKSKSNSKSMEDNDSKKKERYVQKHSDATLLLESVIIGQRPYFAVSEKNDKKVLIKFEESHEDEVHKYLPLGDSMSRCYTFKTDEEFYYYIEQAKREDRDSIYGKVKHIRKKYIDADDFHISICAADTIFTYFQDKIGMTHYLFFVGGNDTGKSNNLTGII